MLKLTNGKSTSGKGYAIFLSGDELDEIRPLIGTLKHVDHGYEIEFSNLAFDSVCDMLIDYEVTSDNKQLQKKLDENKPKLMLPLANVTPPKFKLPPRDYQKEAVEFGLTKDKFLLADMMGLGKTGTMIFLSEILKAYYGFKHVLIVCGINGAKYNWHMIEIPKFSYEQSHILGSKINKAGRLVVGGTAERLEDIQMDHDEFYLIINIESLRNADILSALRYKIVQGEIGMVVIDEIHMAAGRTSAQGKAIHKLKPKFRVGLTGTPIHNKPLEIYNLLVWLGYEHRNFTDFTDEYAYKIPTTTMMNGRIIEFFKLVYKDLTILHDRLKGIMLRRDVSILNLPEPVFMDEYVELDKTQQKVYNSVKEFLIESQSFNGIRMNANDVLVNYGAAFIKARQAISCPHIFGSTRDAKLERTIEILEEAFDEGKSVVIFGWFNETVDFYNEVLSDKFNKLYGEDTILCVNKSTSNAQEVISKFQSADRPMALIGSIGKLGTAFTVTRADYVIFVDKHVVWSDYQQAYMRVWRQGQTKTVVIINLLVKGTVDEHLDYLLAVGKSHGEQVVDGKEKKTEVVRTYGSLDELL